MSDPVRAIADAVLYEGYVLWPYRKSSLKNTRRWTFGGVHPERWSAAHRDDPCELRAGCLLEGGAGTRIDVRARFLHVVARQAFRDGEPVEAVEAGGARHVSWDEATEREAAATGISPAAARRRVGIAVAGGEEREELGGGAALVRGWEPLAGALEVASEPLGDGLCRIAVSIRNTTPWDGGDRDEALRRSFCSTHVVLRAQRGAFVSQTDPPERLRAAAEACESRGLWPVLAGAEGDRSTMLCAPIILPDHPQVAPESPGDLFDATEIDQLLVLSILSMTEEEKREMRAADPRTRAILERTEALSEEELMRLHGTIRERGLARRP